MTTPNHTNSNSQAIRPPPSRPLSDQTDDLNIISSSLPNHPDSRLRKKASRPRLSTPKHHRSSKSNLAWEEYGYSPGDTSDELINDYGFQIQEELPIPSKNSQNETLMAYCSAIARLRQEINYGKVLHQELMDRNDELETSRNIIQNERNNLIQRLETCAKDLAGCESKIQIQQGEIDLHDLEMDKLLRENSRLKKSEFKIKELEDTIATLNQDISNTQRLYSASQMRLSKGKTQFDSLRKAHQKVKKALEKQKAQNSSLEKVEWLKESNAKLKEALEHLTNSPDSPANLHSQMNTLLSVINELTSANSRLKMDLFEYTELLHNSRHSMVDLHDRFKSLHSMSTSHLPMDNHSSFLDQSFVSEYSESNLLSDELNASQQFSNSPEPIIRPRQRNCFSYDLSNYPSAKPKSSLQEWPSTQSSTSDELSNWDGEEWHADEFPIDIQIPDENEAWISTPDISSSTYSELSHGNEMPSITLTKLGSNQSPTPPPPPPSTSTTTKIEMGTLLSSSHASSSHTVLYDGKEGTHVPPKNSLTYPFDLVDEVCRNYLDRLRSSDPSQLNKKMRRAFDLEKLAPHSSSLIDDLIHNIELLPNRFSGQIKQTVPSIGLTALGTGRTRSGTMYREGSTSSSNLGRSISETKDPEFDNVVLLIRDLLLEVAHLRQNNNDLSLKLFQSMNLRREQELSKLDHYDDLSCLIYNRTTILRNKSIKMPALANQIQHLSIPSFGAPNPKTVEGQLEKEQDGSNTIVDRLQKRVPIHVFTSHGPDNPLTENVEPKLATPFMVKNGVVNYAPSIDITKETSNSNVTDRANTLTKAVDKLKKVIGNTTTPTETQSESSGFSTPTTPTNQSRYTIFSNAKLFPATLHQSQTS